MLDVFDTGPPRRSAGTLPNQRLLQDWPKDREFRILSFDGGGIRTASFMAGLEDRFLRGSSIASHFDLIAGTSTGGIIAIGLGAGFRAKDLLQLYVERGRSIFPPYPDTCLGRRRRKVAGLARALHYRYSRHELERALIELLGDRLLGDSTSRLCVPAFEGFHGEIYVYKTPHHPDFQTDAKELMVTVALATAAAPTYYRPLQNNRYVLVDGGVWANNPVMIALVDALTCFRLKRRQIRILSIGCGSKPYRVDHQMIAFGGMWHWREIISGAMHLQSLSALGQAGLLIGADQLIRVDVPSDVPSIELDDWRAAKDVLRAAAVAELDRLGDRIRGDFLARRDQTDSDSIS
jgi:patatin-like phospholipase/acyl hydrolase